MLIQIASDLHLDLVRRYLPGERLISAAPQADLLILAGDIGRGTDAFKIFADWPVPVLYVLGNHEYYEENFDQLRDEAKRINKLYAGSVLLLENETADFSRFEDWAEQHAEELARVRFLGCTLWTDYRHPGINLTQHKQMAAAAASLNDHQFISRGDGLESFMPSHALQQHDQSCRWLEQELDKQFEGKTVVISHHAPHEKSTHVRFEGDNYNGAFVSHHPELVQRTDLWIHGHVHDSFDYTVGRSRVVANPRGYGRSLWGGIENASWENEAFGKYLVVEI